MRLLGIAALAGTLILCAVSGADAQVCNNRGASCSAANKICVDGCYTRYPNRPGRCLSDCGQAFAGCTGTGVWKTTVCNRSGLVRK